MPDLAGSPAVRPWWRRLQTAVSTATQMACAVVNQEGIPLGWPDLPGSPAHSLDLVPHDWLWQAWAGTVDPRRRAICQADASGHASQYRGPAGRVGLVAPLSRCGRPLYLAVEAVRHDHEEPALVDSAHPGHRLPSMGPDGLARAAITLNEMAAMAVALGARVERGRAAPSLLDGQALAAARLDLRGASQVLLGTFSRTLGATRGAALLVSTHGPAELAASQGRALPALVDEASTWLPLALERAAPLFLDLETPVAGDVLHARLSTLARRDSARAVAVLPLLGPDRAVGGLVVAAEESLEYGLAGPEELIAFMQDGGSVLQFAAMRRDESERQRLRHLRAIVAKGLSEAAEAADVNRLLPRLVVGHLGDCCGVFAMPVGGSTPELYALAHVDRQQAGRWSVGLRGLGAEGSTDPVARAFTWQEPVLFRADDRELAELPPQVQALGIHSCLAVPLHQREGRVEAVFVAFASSARIGLDHRDLILARALGEQAVRQIDAAHERERERRESATRDDFLSFLSHELRTPLTSIKGYTQLLRRRLKPVSSEAEHCLDVVEAQSERLLSLINEVLDLSRLESGDIELEPEEFDLRELLSEAAAHLGSRARAREIAIDLPTDAMPVRADRYRIRQVLDNILANALKYSQEDTTIGVSVAVRETEVEIEVRDEGIGISSEHLPHMFQRYYRPPGAKQNRASGLGLGLYVSRMVVEAHGGSIWLDSEEGVGTSVHFTLPRPGTPEG